MKLACKFRTEPGSRVQLSKEEWDVVIISMRE